MELNYDNNTEPGFYKPNESRSGNRQLDHALAEKKYNSMPLWVRLFAEEVQL